MYYCKLPGKKKKKKMRRYLLRPLERVSHRPVDVCVCAHVYAGFVLTEVP